MGSVMLELERIGEAKLAQELEEWASAQSPGDEDNAWVPSDAALLAWAKELDEFGDNLENIRESAQPPRIDDVYDPSTADGGDSSGHAHRAAFAVIISCTIAVGVTFGVLAVMYALHSRGLKHLPPMDPGAGEVQLSEYSKDAEPRQSLLYDGTQTDDSGANPIAWRRPVAYSVNPLFGAQDAASIQAKSGGV